MPKKAREAEIVAAVRTAESRTSGQIICVLARRSSDGEGFAALYAATLALLTPWPLIVLTRVSVQHIFAIQIMVFAAALLILSFTRLGVLLTPRAKRRREVFRAATEQFFTRGLAKIPSRAGVLIYVSQAERAARIVAGDALDDKITPEQWAGALADMTEHLRAGRVTEGFVAAVARIGDLLAIAAPPAEHGGDLPDDLVRL